MTSSDRGWPRAPALSRTALLGLLIGGVVAACVEPPPPRSFNEFMEDRIAREGTLARCSDNSRESLNDIECANARRAAATIALREERERREALELESERKLAALRDQMALRERAEREAAAAAEAAAQAAYEAFWRENSPDGVPPEFETALNPGLPGARPGGADGAGPVVPDEAATQPGTGSSDPGEAPQPETAAGDGLEEIAVPRPFRRR